LTRKGSFEAAFSTIELATASGAKIATKPLEHPESTVLVLPLPALAPGEYSVHWKVVSVDTHSTEGTFHFHIKAP